ncbi:ImmA/IrrE family metallo-endopeptidase [Amycolatopsis sp. CA-230715]|uniref:ImmA/IrrE family metallo-endopeptidase n=1 Tax=Amycolatopsis sp. CA-230715 TaxID=2745196 RepID=UPI001C02AD29|nr:ImmA/IrrE family metallo-endopeptidase [Amycolatopsis sp. CA-230715]QWF85204.1 hypothetical protein HUW46_08658 [Amycolatopsis sp. CA-230715]
MTAAEGVADRLNWLFEVVAAPVETGDAATDREAEEVDGPQWRPYTNAEVGDALAAALGRDHPAAGRAAVERLRAGGAATDEQLAAVAEFFGIEPEFFGDDQSRVDAVRDQVLELAFRDSGVSGYLICRGRRPSAAHRRIQLWKALHTVRPTALPSVNVSPSHSRRSPADRRDDRPLPDGASQDSGSSMTAPMSEAQLRTLCRDLVHDLGLGTPFDAHELCRRLADRRGRPIKVRAIDLGATTGVGHLVPKRRADHILVEHTAPASQQALVIYHEVIHLVRDHLEVGDTLTCGLAVDPDDEQGAYTDWREREAEIGARTLSAMSRERPRPNRLPVAAGPADQSIAAAFGFVGRPRPT